MIEFLKEFLKALGVLVIKMTESRKSFYQFLNVIISGILMILLQDEILKLYVYTVFNIGNFIYFGFITFEAVKTSITVNK